MSMNWKIVLLRDAILRALDHDDTRTIKSILKQSLLKTSDHWQERMIGEEKATDADFFYDVYMGPPLSKHSTPAEGDLVSFTKSSILSGSWYAVDETGESFEIPCGTVGIVLEKRASLFEEYDHDYQVIVDEKIFNDLSDNMFDKKN